MTEQTQDATDLVFNAFVHLTDSAGHHHAFGPGDPVPDWARPLVGDHVLHHGPAPTEPTQPDDLLAQSFGGEDDGLGVVEPPKPPPISGPGSGWPAWAAFAKAVGQPVEAEQSRQDIIDALIRNGHLSE